MNSFLAASSEVDLLDYLSRAGVVVFLVLALYGFKVKWWVWGWQYDELHKRHDIRGEKLDKAIENGDAWKEQALTGVRLARESQSIASAAVQKGIENEQKGPGRG